MLNMDGNLHSGHRERLIEKFVESPDSMANHELLEILLFSVLPRKDTNALAHRLLMTFGGFKRLFSATPKELMSVNGVGKRVASQIAVFGKLINAVNVDHNKKQDKLFSFHKNKEYVMNLFTDPFKEKFILILMDSSCKVITQIEFDTFSENMVRFETSKLAKAIAMNNPAHALIAHNHPSGSLTPSRDDDIATAKIYMVCKLQGVNLIDHVIVTKNDAFSYFIDGRLNDIFNKVDLDDISKKI